MSKKFCKYCGAELDPASGACPNCGGAPANNAPGGEETVGADRTLISDRGNNADVNGPQGNKMPPTVPVGGNYGTPEGPTVAQQYDGYGYDSGSDYNSDYNSDYGSGYNSDYGSGYGPGQNAGAPTGKGGKSQALILVLVVAVVILVGVVVFLILMKTGVITVGSGGNEPAAAVESETRAATDGVRMSLSGSVEKRTADSGDYYVLKMGSKREFHPYAPYDETYGSKFEADEVQLLGSEIPAYVGHTVRVDGTQRYRTESAHKLDVIMEVDSVEDLGEAVTAPLTTAAPATQAVQQPAGNSAQLRNTMQFRTGPSTGYASMGTIAKGTWVTVVGSSGDWAQIYYNGRYGWVHGTYAFGWAASSPLPTSQSSSSSRALRNNMKLRSGPGTNYSYSTVIPKGTYVTVIRYSGDWAYVSSGYGTGWVYVPYAF